MSASIEEPCGETGDVTRWWTLWDADACPHVMPAIGPYHEMTLRCWCRPTKDEGRYACEEPVIVHHMNAQ